MWWMLAVLLIASAAWALAEVLLNRVWRNGRRHDDLYCHYCEWGLSRARGSEAHYSEGRVYCSLTCLHHDAALREREQGLG
jgi:hypothetical protein